jgi:hypothetical protein
MEKKEIVCPHCGKKKAKIEITYRSGGLVDEVKVKGFDWFPTIKAIGHNEWMESLDNGIGLGCKCGKAFFAYDIASTEQPPSVEPGLRENLLAAWFCEPCGIAFANNTLVCPSCGEHYTGGD